MILLQRLPFLVLVCGVVFCEQKCPPRHPIVKADYESHLGSKTPYRFVANLNDSRIQVPGCEPIKIWMIIRHGTRYPGDKYIRKMEQILPNLQETILNNSDKGTLCKDALWALRKWKLYARIGDDKDLAPEGKGEMIDFAQRMQNRFPFLLPTEFNNKTYYFKYTQSQRCAESARYFALGLFGRNDSKTVWYPDPVHKDPLLRFYKSCDKWHVTVKNNKETYVESEKFAASKLFQQVRENVTQRLGLDTLISIDNLQLLYTICGFDTAWGSDVSLWCLLFTPEEIKVLEYLEDVERYWVDGYGYNLTKQQACPLIKHFVEFTESTSRAALNFAHSGTILKLFGHLGLYHDVEPLKSDNFDKMERLWKLSEIDAFGSNLGFVLFECSGVKKLMVLHQEKQVYIPGCPSNDLCPLDTFKNLFSESINECNVNEMCSLQDS